ncbi:unnamed protein product [Urochloa humidicola]
MVAALRPPQISSSTSLLVLRAKRTGSIELGATTAAESEHQPAKAGESELQAATAGQSILPSQRGWQSIQRIETIPVPII